MLQSHLVVTLVFGVGYLGSRLVQELLFQGREVIAFDNLFSSDRRAIESFSQLPGFRFVEGSIVDPDAIRDVLESAVDVETVYLLAAQSSGHADAAPPNYTEDVNLRGPRLVLDGLIRARIRAPIVYASSTRVYGSPLPEVVDETTPYGRFTDLSHLSKCYAEKLLEMYAWRENMTCRSVRIGLAYGVAPVMKTDPRFMTAPNLFCLRAARGEPLDVRTSEAVALVHVDDVARGLLWASERLTDPAYQTINLAPDVATIGAIAQTVARLAVERELPPINIRADRAIGTDESLPRISSALTSLGFTASRGIRDGLAETLDHFLVHRQ